MRLARLSSLSRQARPRGSAPWNPAKGEPLEPLKGKKGGRPKPDKSRMRPPFLPFKNGFLRLCLKWGVQGGNAPLAFFSKKARQP
jgi:hypothetical protein